MNGAFDVIERQKIQAAYDAAAKSGKVQQRTLARQLLASLPGRTFNSIYAEVRRMLRTGGWWSHVPVGHSVV